MNIEKQWHEDVEEHGDAAYKLWHWHWVRDYPINKYADFKNNAEVIDCIENGFDDVAERKGIVDINL